MIESTNEAKSTSDSASTGTDAFVLCCLSQIAAPVFEAAFIADTKITRSVSLDDLADVLDADPQVRALVVCDSALLALETGSAEVAAPHELLESWECKVRLLVRHQIC
ncbi:hypothetical protein ROG8370_02398 [Roseovarius gaetbuli]|uniref:Uncharacterized protein n=1 Tax=Roseovarius gaetbuli TaxID=1356575 RepID=A0A1X6ZJ40_9RHOB|nr:hypothetical protein [Roseovarius gaetbuli]SLN53100.1 hypothetical protein ROG8370_02398 [Roseovarius gaetbuli]